MGCGDVGALIGLKDKQGTANSGCPSFRFDTQAFEPVFQNLGTNPIVRKVVVSENGKLFWKGGDLFVNVSQEDAGRPDAKVVDGSGSNFIFRGTGF